MTSACRRACVLGLVATAALAINGLAACGGSASSASGPASGGAGSTPAGGSGGNPFVVSRSRLFYLTRLTGGQLCGLLSPGEAAQVLGGPTGPGTFSAGVGLSIYCRWFGTTGTGEFTISISKVEDWQETRSTDVLVPRWTSVTIDGHPAIYFGTHLDVAAAGPGDPAVTFDAVTLAQSLKLAQLVMPRLAAIRSAG